MKNFFLVGIVLVFSSHFAHAQNIPAPGDGCIGLKGSRFVSVNDYAIGETRTSIVTGKWSLEFDRTVQGRVYYRHSDVISTSGYLCSGVEGTLELTGLPKGSKVVGAYNKETGHILWEGRWFKQSN